MTSPKFNLGGGGGKAMGFLLSWFLNFYCFCSVCQFFGQFDS